MKEKVLKEKSKESFVKTGVNRPGRNEPGPHSIPHPEKNNLSGLSKKLNGVFPKKGE
jgi:hypothetical protein